MNKALAFVGVVLGGSFAPRESPAGTGITTSRAATSSRQRDVKTQRMIVTAVAIALYVGWFVVYVSSLDLHGRNFDYENFVFDADGTRVVKVVTVLGATFSSDRHPLYVSMLQPLGLALEVIIRDPILTALCVTTSLATLGVPAAFAVLRRSAGGLLDGLLWTMLFAGSSAVWLFAAMPETFAINAATIVVGYALQVTPSGARPPPERFRRKLVLHILFATIATGMTLTNSVYALISFCSLAWKHRPPAKWRRFLLTRIAVFIVSVTLLLGVLSKLQNVSYHDTHEFTGATGYTDVVHSDQRYVIVDGIPGWLLTEARTFFANSIVAPRAKMTEVLQINPRVLKTSERWQIVQFTSSPGWMFWVCCGFALAFCVALAMRKNAATSNVHRWRPEIAMSGAAIGFNVALHSFYRGIGEPLMYATHVVFPIVFLLSVLYGRSALPGKRVLLFVLTIGVLATNAVFLSDVNRALRSGAPNPFRAPPEGRVLGL
jgi:hypothetical protein